MISNYFTSAIIFCLFPDNKYTKNMLINWYSEKLLVYILKLKTSKTKLNLSELKVIIEYSASFSILKNLDITVNYKKLKEEWKLVDITEKHLAIFKEYEKVYDILNEFNEELALNLFVCRVFPKIIEQKDDYVLISLEFGDYENLLLKIEKQKDDGEKYEYQKCSVVFNSLSMKNKIIFKKACSKTNVKITGDANW